MRRLALAGALVLALLAAAFLAWLFWSYHGYIHGPEPALVEEKLVEIEPGMSFDQVEDMLCREGVISNRSMFTAGARWRGLTTRVQAGEYTIKPGMTPLEILDLITRGDVTIVKLIVPEGFTIFDIARRLGSLGPWSEDRFLALATDKEKAKAFHVPVPTLEGYLFPAVYELKFSMSEDVIIDLMVRRGLKEKTARRVRLAQNIDLSWHQVLTMASLIEKETAKKDEMATIAGVFMKRLEKGMLLQSDPTAVYGIKDFKGPIKKTDLIRPGAYNTYLHRGLPPGPICNPGQDAIMAALNPEPTDYLYFVATGDGGHAFASTYLEHRRNIRKYKK